MDKNAIDALLRQYDKKHYFYYKKSESFIEWPVLSQVPPGISPKLKKLFQPTRRKPPPVTLPKLKFMEFPFNEDWSTSTLPKKSQK